jgi:nucleoside-diphosphate-sugar epimerase
MKCLVLGGTGFIGPFVVAGLQRLGHNVAVFHRGKTKVSFSDVEEIFGDRRELGQHATSFRRFNPDVVIDMILSSGTQATVLMQVFEGIANRVVAVSSMDVYRAFGVFHVTDAGPVQALPLTEKSDLRQALHPYPSEALQRIQKIFQWLDTDYDKIPVERAVLANTRLPGTVLRLPMVYGLGDPLHRFFPILKRMLDGREKILMSQEIAEWRSPRGYVENVAAAIALAASSEQAVGNVYNVAEQRAFSELEWTQEIAKHAGWKGQVIVLPRERLPVHLLPPGNFAQHATASSEKIRRELGYREHVPSDESIRRTIEWERENPPAQTNLEQFDYPAEDAVLRSENPFFAASIFPS